MLTRQNIMSANVSQAVKKLFLRAWEDTSGLVPGSQAAFGAGAPNGATVGAREFQWGGRRKTILTLTAAPVTLTDAAGSAQWGGTAKLYDFPEGLLVIESAILTGTLTLGATGTFIDDYTGVCALGTATATVTTPNTLTTTEADILPSTAIGTAAAKVSAVEALSIPTALTESGARWFDGTTTAKDLYLNFSIADDATHTSGTGVFTGTIQLVWGIAGDN